jgi:hypothetical protein
MTMRRKRAALITLCILMGLVSVPVALTWREVRQEQLNHALIAAVERHDAATVRSLLRQGADPNAPILPNDKRSAWTRLLDHVLDRPVPTAFDTDSLLLKAVGWQPKRGPVSLETPAFDNADITRMLAESGATVNFQGTGDQYESFMGNLGMHELSLGSDVRWHTTPLLTAVGFQQWGAVKVLLAHHGEVNATDTFGNTPLMYAAGFDNTEALNALLDCGADVNARNHCGETALLFALDAYRIMLEWRPMPELRATVACLLQHGASVNIHDSTGMSVLTMAYFYGNKDERLLRMLKHAGAKK